MAAAAIGTAAAQPSADAIANAQRELAAAIDAEAARNGPSSPALIVPLEELSGLYEQSGDLALAIDAVRQSLAVMRINRGLYTLDQAPLLQRLIRNEDKRGNAKAAWDTEKKLLVLVKRHPGDLRTAAVLRGIGDRRKVILARYLAGEFPVEIELGCYYRVPVPTGVPPDTGCRSGSRSMLIFNLQREAESFYRAAAFVEWRHANEERAQPQASLSRPSGEHAQ